MKIYEICTYDVWGNPTDGFDVNMVYATGEMISLTDEATLRQIIIALKNEGIIRRNCRFATFQFAPYESDTIIYIERAKDGMPLLELRMVSE